MRFTGKTERVSLDENASNHPVLFPLPLLLLRPCAGVT
jgi:hypothetical protein